tara:strand:+ start:1835 stop:2362 length:528 start_codon:yes stop_codon:yes gene_type:complete
MGNIFVITRYVFGLIKSLIYSLIYLNSLFIDKKSKTFLNCQITIRNKGKFKINGGINVYPGTLINIYGGTLKTFKGVAINRNCTISCHHEILIGENTLIGPNVSIYDHDHKIANKKIKKNDFSKASIKIGSNVLIGANSIILKGVKIGDNVVIAAGSIISKDIPDGTKYIQKRFE